MMLDAVELAAQALARKGSRQQIRNALRALRRLRQRDRAPALRSGRWRQQIAKLAQEIGPAVLIDRDVVHISSSCTPASRKQ